MAHSGLSPVSGGSTIDHSSQVTKIIVDPHEADSFVIDLSATGGITKKYSVSEDNSQELRAAGREDRSKMIANSLRRFSAQSEVSAAPPALGRVSSTVDGGNHVHPSAELPDSAVIPPSVRVYFDLPGLASLNYKYHGASVVTGYLVLTTDMRYAGPGEFYPFTSNSHIAGDAPPQIGVMVDGIDRLFAIVPPVIKHKFGPYEHCILPISQERDLPKELRRKLEGSEKVEASPQAVEESTNTGLPELDEGVL